MSTKTKRLRDALTAWAKGDINTGQADGATAFTRDACATIMQTASIRVTDAELDRATTAFARCPFYGGNYTLDAKRILAALGPQETP